MIKRALLISFLSVFLLGPIILDSGSWLPSAFAQEPTQEPDTPPAAETTPPGEQPEQESVDKTEEAPAETTDESVDTEVDESAAPEPIVTRSHAYLPNSTCAWISIPNPRMLNESFATTQLGHLLQDESLKPLVDQITEQIRETLDDNSVQHGIRLSDLETLETGEICIAGILPRDATGAIKPEKRAIVLLVDVSKCLPEAEALLEKTGQELTNAGAVPTTEVVNEIKTTKWTFPNSRTRARQRIAHQAIVNNWIVASNEGDSFRQVLRWIARPDLPVVETLAEDADFNQIMARSDFDSEDTPAHIRWYVEPFGYLDLARILAEEDENPATKERSNNFAKIVKESGFDAIQGVSGSIAVKTGSHEILHRTFVYAPAIEEAGEERYQKSAAILDFFNRDQINLDPEDWVPKNAASYITLTWNFEKVVNHVHHVVDAMTAEGSFERMLANVKETNNFDVREVVKHLNNRVSVASEVVDPIDANCEKIVVAVGLDGDRDFVTAQVKNFFGHALEVETDGEHEYYFEAEEEEEDDFLFGDEFGGEEEEPQDQGLIEKKYVTVQENAILISNDLDYLKSIVNGQSTEMAESSDYVRIRQALDALVESDNVSLRHFGRLDQVMRANYELARRNELRGANTLLARLIAQADQEAIKKGEQPIEFNGEKMPVFDAYVAPYLGPTGWVIESEEDGWRITSCLLTSGSELEQAEVADKTGQATPVNGGDEAKR